MASSSEASGQARRKSAGRVQEFLITEAPVLSIACFFLVVVLVFASITDAFLSQVNLLNLLRQAAPTLIVAVAMTLVITTGGIDLSVGSTLALTGALAATAIAAGIPWLLVLPAMLALGAAIGGLNGYFTAYAGIPAFIVTLASLSVVRGTALLLTQGYSIPIPSDIGFVWLGRGWLLGLPVPAILAVLVVLAGWLVLTRTRYGRYVTGVGANAEAVRRAGVDVRRIVLSVYVLTGLAGAAAGLLIAARLGSGSSNQAVGFELEVIAAVVLGGTSLFGGRGTVLGTVLGALTIAVIGNGLILARISPFFTQIVTGAIILAAIWFNTRLLARARTLRVR
ncbi:ABC transporter permease [Marinivivus vitaminiproducens]|uniref:ABC transporter permease n=1 Tax=Marinivivus vitaminiproducens TaxID=3035935 RepID=UPI0027AB06AA|nr:ABC transporter permease [Geminicoccaceae bacterium SCSIO 64248]